jgi:ParB family chromosome partitioning protein
VANELRHIPSHDIKYNPDHRQDLGDMDALVDSIRAVGLLHPLVVTPDLRLVAGRRRLLALLTLQRDTAPVYVVEGLDSALAFLRAERDENTCRKDFTPSEAVAIGKELEKLERHEARARQLAARIRVADALELTLDDLVGRKVKGKSGRKEG